MKTSILKLLIVYVFVLSSLVMLSLGPMKMRKFSESAVEFQADVAVNSVAATPVSVPAPVKGKLNGSMIILGLLVVPGSAVVIRRVVLSKAREKL